MPELKLVTYDTVFLDKSWQWLNDPEINYLTSTGEFSKEDQQNWFQNLPNLKNYKIWGVIYDGEPIGVFGIKKIENGQGEYWGYIGEKSLWGKGLGKIIMEKIIDECKIMKLTDLFLKVLASNIRAVKLYKKFGFELVSEEGNTISMAKKLKSDEEFR